MGSSKHVCIPQQLWLLHATLSSLSLSYKGNVPRVACSLVCKKARLAGPGNHEAQGHGDDDGCFWTDCCPTMTRKSHEQRLHLSMSMSLRDLELDVGHLAAGFECCSGLPTDESIRNGVRGGTEGLGVATVEVVYGQGEFVLLYPGAIIHVAGRPSNSRVVAMLTKEIKRG
jgi:hypothetical protein